MKNQIRKALLYLNQCRKQPNEVSTVMSFLFKRHQLLSFSERLSITRQIYRISALVPCPHLQHEILSFINAILAIPPTGNGCIVEAGCYKGGSTAKFSLAASLVGRKLVVFDSFSGIPPNNEIDPDGELWHEPGSWCGTRDEVERNIKRFGVWPCTQLVEGFFEETLPHFSEPVAAAYVDVDLVSSTRTCLRYLFPLLVPGGVLLSHDGHLPDVIQLYDDDDFWENEVGCKKPVIEGLGTRKLLKIKKRVPVQNFRSDCDLITFARACELDRQIGS